MVGRRGAAGRRRLDGDPRRGGRRCRRRIDPCTAFFHGANLDQLGHRFRGGAIRQVEGQVERRIIDIFGDGTDNSGRSVTQARDQAVSTGLTINGLAIINDSPNLGYSGHSHPPGGLENYYRQNVIGGPNAFVLVVEDFKSFADAMAKKLAKEIDVADRSAVGRSSSRPSE